MVMIRGVDIDHDLSGRGSDVIWGHGLTSSREAEDDVGLIDWSVIREKHRVLRYDARGHGASGSTEDPFANSRLPQLRWPAMCRAMADARSVAGGPVDCAAASSVGWP